MFGKGVWHQGDAKTGIDHGGHQRGGGQLTNNIGGEACQVEAVHDRIIKGGGTVLHRQMARPARLPAECTAFYLVGDPGNRQVQLLRQHVIALHMWRNNGSAGDTEVDLKIEQPAQNAVALRTVKLPKLELCGRTQM